MQWGSDRLFSDGRFATADGRAHFSALTAVAHNKPADAFFLSTRRGKQFNSMIQRHVDPLTGADRDDILISQTDLTRLRLAEGASVRLRAELLSALIGSISLIPFIISSGTGAEIEKPLAIVVVGGLVTRPIKIVMLPMVYEWVERRAARRAARRP